MDTMSDSNDSPTASENEAIPTFRADDVEWVVNDNAELGVKIGDQFFFCYKGRSLVYEDGRHDDGTPMHWRPVFKREFGECIHPINYRDLTKIGAVSLDDSDEWRQLPAAREALAPASDSLVNEGETGNCITNMLSSRICERGTPCCVVSHQDRVPSSPQSAEAPAGSGMVDVTGDMKRATAKLKSALRAGGGPSSPPPKAEDAE